MDVVCWSMIFLVVLVIVLFLLSGIRVVKEYERGVIFRLGKFQGVKGPGIFYILPIFDSMQKVDLRVITVDVPPQEAITKDNVTAKVNAVLYYRVSSPKTAIINVENYRLAISEAAQTTVRSIIGQYSLDELLKNRDMVNQRLSKILDEMSDPWGIRVTNVETKDLMIPESMQRAMAKEAEAEREKRSRLIKAQAELESASKLAVAAQQISAHPSILELRRLQTIAEVGIEQNTTTIILMPSDFVTFAKHIGEAAKEFTKKMEGEMGPP
ncbi:MAG: slipin family protein [Methanomassiliicoccales archaeon]|nr:MAG: slipin family protein [Methanomassiliicoccales archaeon]